MTTDIKVSSSGDMGLGVIEAAWIIISLVEVIAEGVESESADICNYTAVCKEITSIGLPNVEEPRD